METKELNLCELLKGCEGMELWSDIFGKCKLESLNGDASYKIKVSGLNTNQENYACQSFTKYGRFYDCYPDGKCMLWPSETNRDWSKFKKPIKIKEGDWVVCGWSVRDVVIRRYFKDDKCFNVDSPLTLDWTFIAPFEKYDPNLSDEELKKLSIV